MTRALRPMRDGLAATLALALAACAPAPQRPTPAPPSPVPTPSVPPSTATPEAPPPIARAPESPWPRLRAQFAMQRCDYRPQVQHWVRAYTQSPRHLFVKWQAALPFIEIVVDEIETRDLPGELAMLPFVESDYRPIATRGDRPAGMWQLVPDTARAQRLVVGDEYDGRLDALASTQAALDLIGGYYKEFADWRLADFAYNAGEFRVKKLLRERDARTMSADELGKLPFNKVTHDHLDRMLALACIIEDPARYGVKLPEGNADTRLVAVDLDNGMDLRVAARLAGLSIADVRLWNAGYRQDRMDERAPHRLLLPESRVERFRAASAAIPVAFWNDWHEEPAGRTGALDGWAAASGIPVEALASANAMTPGESVSRSATLLLPGRETRAALRSESVAARNTPRTHVIASGDTLSGIAHRYDIPLKRLRALNPQMHGTLRIGSRLVIDADAG